MDCMRVPACLHTGVVVLLERAGHVHKHIMCDPSLHPGMQMGLPNLHACTGMSCCAVMCACRMREHQCIGICEYACIYEHVLSCMGWCAAVHVHTLALVHVCTYAFVWVCRGTFMHLCTGFSQRKHKEKDVVKTSLLPVGLQAPGKHQNRRRFTVLELGEQSLC